MFDKEDLIRQFEIAKETLSPNAIPSSIFREFHKLLSLFFVYLEDTKERMKEIE